MSRRTSNAALAVCCVFLALSARAVAQEVSLGAAQQKMTAASNVRARNAPDTAAQEVTRLKLGTVLTADARSAEQSEVGGKRDYWYRVALPAGASAATGWVFGGLLADYDAARRAEVVGRIVEERLKAESMSFNDGMDFYDFITSALSDARDPEARGELERARLRALGMAVASIPDGQEQQPPYHDFHKAHAGEIYHHELAGGWYVNPEAYWQLETKYRGTRAGDRIAWDASQAMRNGECESDEVCDFLATEETQGKYLLLYPQGEHAAEAMQNIAQALASTSLDETVNRRGGDKYAVEEQTMVKKALVELRTAVSKTGSPEKAAVMKRLDQLSPRAR